MSFAAIPEGLPLAAHNVLFADDPSTEYAALAKGQQQDDPTLYICAQDRFGGASPTGPERFEIILNSPALTQNAQDPQKERDQCLRLILDRLARFALTFTPRPGPEWLSMPQDFAALFPHSKGALYGRSPHGMLAPFKRPTARTALPGLYLTGGGVHPGPGVPMATLSAKHAAEAILSDLHLMSPSPQPDTPGGTLTGSATMAPARSL
jgi:1-hydroxycarotenoid 3,4-desaturase